MPSYWGGISLAWVYNLWLLALIKIFVPVGALQTGPDDISLYTILDLSLSLHLILWVKQVPVWCHISRPLMLHHKGPHDILQSTDITSLLSFQCLGYEQTTWGCSSTSACMYQTTWLLWCLRSSLGFSLGHWRANHLYSHLGFYVLYPYLNMNEIQVHIPSQNYYYYY